MSASEARLLLDTCAAIWTSHDAAIEPAATARLNSEFDEGNSVFVSPITAWEAGLLVSRGRAAFASGPKQWFANLIGVRGVALAEMPPGLLIESSNLPGTPPRDPADRIIIATARELGLCILTRDRLILDYADKGLVLAMAC